MRKFIIASSLLATAFAFYGCAGLELPPPPAAQAPTPAPVLGSSSESRSLAKVGGKQASIVIQIPANNPAAKRYPNVYVERYVIGYMSAWNEEVTKRVMKFRSYEGKFSSPAAEANFHLYDGEKFDLEKHIRERQAKQNPADRYGSSGADAFKISDETSAGTTGMSDGKIAARADFAKTMIPQER